MERGGSGSRSVEPTFLRAREACNLQLRRYRASAIPAPLTSLELSYPGHLLAEGLRNAALDLRQVVCFGIRADFGHRLANPPGLFDKLEIKTAHFEGHLELALRHDAAQRQERFHGRRDPVPGECLGRLAQIPEGALSTVPAEAAHPRTGRAATSNYRSRASLCRYVHYLVSRTA